MISVRGQQPTVLNLTQTDAFPECPQMKGMSKIEEGTCGSATYIVIHSVKDDIDLLPNSLTLSICAYFSIYQDKSLAGSNSKAVKPLPKNLKELGLRYAMSKSSGRKSLMSRL